MSALTLEPLHLEFGARITCIDLREPVDDDTMEAIRVAIDTYSLLHFRDQPFDDDRQLAFTRRLGEPEPSHVAFGEEGRIDYFGTIGNVQADGTVLGNNDNKTIFLSGNYMWHSDSSFRPVPSFVSIMCAYEVPAEGGETSFVSARAAYKRLPEKIKSEIDPLVAVHDYVYSRSKVAPDAVSPSLAKSLPPVRQKLVRTNPRTGEKNYYVGSHAKTIVGWKEAESREFLDDLTKRACGAEHLYTHEWRSGDLVIWDNRCLLHRGTGYDADRYRRYMRQTRVKGACSTLEE